MTLVVDSGFVVAALVDGGPAGTWADELLGSEDLVRFGGPGDGIVLVTRRVVERPDYRRLHVHYL